ncbi:MAG: hypothetical protein R3C44_13020 [Chloroflexota bacterium]
MGLWNRVALGLGLTSDPLFISGLVALIPVWIWTSRREKLTVDSPETRASSEYLRPSALAFGITFLALSTSFLLYTPGLGAALEIVTGWLGSFGLPTPVFSANGILLPFVTALRYERRSTSWVYQHWPGPSPASAKRRAHGGWLGLLAGLALLQSQLPGYALLFTIPGYLLIGLMARNLFIQSHKDYRTTLSLWPGACSAGNDPACERVGRYARLALWSSDQIAFLVLALFALIAAGGVLVLAMSYNSLAARQGAFLGLAVLSPISSQQRHTLTQTGANDPRERAVVEERMMMFGCRQKSFEECPNKRRAVTMILT